jgi:hypothetical protein
MERIVNNSTLSTLKQDFELEMYFLFNLSFKL